MSVDPTDYETVLIASRRNGLAAHWHRDGDCRYLSRSRVQALPADSETVAMREPCRACVLDEPLPPHDGGDHSLNSALHEADSLEDLRADGGRVQACPECDSSQINRRVSKTYGDGDRWLCYTCGHTFGDGDVVERATRNGLNGAPRRLAQTDVDDHAPLVPDDDLRSDGGQDLFPITVADRDHLVRRLPGAATHGGDRRGYCERCRASITLVDGGAVTLEVGEEAGHQPGCPHRPPQLPSGRRARVATDGGERP